MKTCFHCGDECREILLEFRDKNFCCNGCRTVFEIFEDNDLSYYYDLSNTPGTSPVEISNKFDFLDNDTIVEKLLEFNNGDIQIVSFLIPSIHCSSCIWVLENLNKLYSSVKSSQVNFPEKKIRITYDSKQGSMKDLVLLLARIGYEPYISLEDGNKKKIEYNRSLIYQLGVAGFAFGNVMFLSFPEYFNLSSGEQEFWLEKFKTVFRWLMFSFSVPVVLYSAKDYFISAYKGIRSNLLNIDVPIAIGIAALFVRSTIDIIFDWGSGFFDSLTGLVFFLLLGKFFQQKTYSFLSFERDYKSYFPIAVTRIDRSGNEKKEEQVEVYNIKRGDLLLIRNNELIPVDAILIKGNALIDYSFVTGEAAPIKKSSGDRLFAGGRQEGGIIEIEVQNPVEQSYLTQLWSNDIFDKKARSAFQSLTDSISKMFTIVVLTIAFLSTVLWIFVDSGIAFNVFTAVLIIACPCAIALASPFTLGNLLRIFGRNKLYLKEASVIEQMARVDTVVFDKTGTLTTNKEKRVSYEGDDLSKQEVSLLASTLRASNHPLSRALYGNLEKDKLKDLSVFNEEVGKGIYSQIGNAIIRIGSFEFVMTGSYAHAKVDPIIQRINKTTTHISINDEYKGYYIFDTTYRDGVKEIFDELKITNKVIVLSGDNEGERERLEQLLPKGTDMFFNQKPEDKLMFIRWLQKEGKTVMMVGDGLNDAGALKQSDVGIAISENINVFSPACDGIFDANRFKDFVKFIQLSKTGLRIIKWSFLFSLIYNLIGLSFAVTGKLLPVIAAVLMPLSSISIVVFTTLTTQYFGRKLENSRK